MESSAAGLAALALFVLWLGYFVPHRARHRQQLLESRVDDRFSAGLRVLAVADGVLPRVPVPAGAPAGLLGPGSAPRLLPARAAAPAPSGGRGPGPADDSRQRTTDDGPGEQPMVQDPRASRQAALELRARRARRRLTLTLVLLLLTAGAWAAVGLGPVLWYAALAPTALLVAVLVLGRMAAAAAARSDARWAADRRAEERRALEERAVAAGGPRAPRNRARVTGTAVRGSSDRTEMIPRVASVGRVTVIEGTAEVRDDVVTAAASGSTPSASTSEGSTAEGSTPEAAAGASGAAADVPSAQAEPEARAASSTASSAVSPADRRARGARAGEAWDPVPVPLPTYVTKAAAPRREPKPLTGTMPARDGAPMSTGWSSSPWQRVEDRPEDYAPATTSWSLGRVQDAALGATSTPATAAPDAGDAAATPAVAASVAAAPVGVAADAGLGGDALDAEDSRPRTETLGLPLEQILARRRAAG